jgi:hypothetical protein
LKNSPVQDSSHHVNLDIKARTSAACLLVGEHSCYLLTFGEVVVAMLWLTVALFSSSQALVSLLHTAPGRMREKMEGQRERLVFIWLGVFTLFEGGRW